MCYFSLVTVESLLEEVMFAQRPNGSEEGSQADVSVNVPHRRDHSTNTLKQMYTQQGGLG